MANSSISSESIKNVANEKIDTAEELALNSLESGREAVINVVDTASNVQAEAEIAIADTTEKLTRYVKENPVQAAGIAFAAGVLTTLLLTRR